MSARRFDEALRRAEEKLVQAGLPADADRRLRARLEQRKRRSWLPVVGVLAAAACALVLYLRAGSTSAPVARSVDAQFDGLRITDASTNWQMRREADGVRVVSGIASIEVQKRAPGTGTAKIWVSHGLIEVLGTRFTVEQRAESGNVRLHEGSIRYTGDDGRQTQLSPGQTLSWPQPVEPTPPRHVPRPEHTPPTRPDVPPSQPSVDIEVAIGRVAILRSQGRYDEALRALDEALAASLGAGSKERLSFERGSILTHQLRDHDRACTHWRSHLRAFPSGRYDAEISRAVTELGCEQAVP